MTIQGDDGADNCIVSGAFNPNSSSSMFRGQSLTGIVIKDLTLSDMDRSGGTSGGVSGACYLNQCTGSIQGCVIQNNSNSGIWLSIPEGGTFNLLDNTFTGNSGGGVSVGSAVGAAV